MAILSGSEVYVTADGGVPFTGVQTFGSAPMPVPSGSAPIYACRAWVNFNGVGTVAIGVSGNVSSVTDNGVGDYTVNFTTAMPDTNYSTNVTARASLGAGEIPTYGATTASSVNANIYRGDTNVLYDPAAVSVTIFR